jgi:hypothetical protein
LLLGHPGVVLNLNRLLGSIASSSTGLRSSSFGFGGLLCFLGFPLGFLLSLSGFLLLL